MINADSKVQKTINHNNNSLVVYRCACQTLFILAYVTWICNIFSYRSTLLIDEKAELILTFKVFLLSHGLHFEKSVFLICNSEFSDNAH